LGTHAPMSGEAIESMVGPAPFPVINHEWWNDGAFTHVGRLEAPAVALLAGVGYVAILVLSREIGAPEIAMLGTLIGRRRAP